MKTYAVALPLLMFAGAPAMAAPGVPGIPADESLITNVQAIHRDCAWVNNKWTYKRGDKMLVCRPNRPSGAGWTWYRDGGREGWYHKKRKAWHHQNW